MVAPKPTWADCLSVAGFVGVVLGTLYWWRRWYRKGSGA
jgi:hypothetical protein